MADDESDEKSLAKRRRRQRSSKDDMLDSADRPLREGGAHDQQTATRDELEQRVLGAVRQAVADVMQDAKPSAALPSIDMNFVATRHNQPSRERVNHPASDEELSFGPAAQPAHETGQPRRRSTSLFMLTGILSLVLLFSALLFTMRANEDLLFDMASVSESDRPLAKNSQRPDQIAVPPPQPALDPSPIIGPADFKQNELTAGEQSTDLFSTRNGDVPRRSTSHPHALASGEAQTLAAVHAAEQQLLRQTAEQGSQQVQDRERERRVALHAAEIKAGRAAETQKRRREREAEHKRLAALRAAEDKANRKAAERKIQRQREAEHQRLAALQAAVEAARREAVARKKSLAEQAERVRIALLREAKEKARREAAERKLKAVQDAERARLAARRAARRQALAEAGIRDSREMDDLMAATKQRLRSEGVLTERLHAVLREAKQARVLSDRVRANSGELPEAWAAEEKVRLKLEQVLTDMSKVQVASDTPRLRHGPTEVRSSVTLLLKDSDLKISGLLIKHDARSYVVQLPSNEQVTLPSKHFNCITAGCPKLRD